MKKLATTFGLLALMLIVTSFTTPKELGGRDSGGGLIVENDLGGRDSGGGLIVINNLGGRDSGGGL